MFWMYAAIIQFAIIAATIIYLVFDKTVLCPKCGKHEYIVGPTYLKDSERMKWCCGDLINYRGETTASGCHATWYSDPLDNKQTKKEKLLAEKEMLLAEILAEPIKKTTPIKEESTPTRKQIKKSITISCV